MAVFMRFPGFRDKAVTLSYDDGANADRRVVEIMQSKKLIACTGCKYCMERCPTGIKIPKLFSCLNGRELYRAWNAAYYYSVHTKNGGLASACIDCGLCEEICPQHLPIRDLLRDVAAAFEK